MHNASTNIQRVWRGKLGRARARKERDKYLFSKSQSQSIEFGRQMLMEHKLHGTKLQSEVSTLTHDKIETEEAIQQVNQEINTFHNAVYNFERQMNELSSVETREGSNLDEDAKAQLRVQKNELDRNFSAMLVKIADRKEKLQNLEVRLQKIDATREAKQKELSDLDPQLCLCILI
jgi:chromosome segregation ATPase